MARARLLKPGFFSNEKLTEINAFGRLLFVGLWTIADRRGRLKDSPKWIKGAIFPYENVAVDRMLNDLQRLGFIQRYEADGERYIHVVNFEKHQHVHIKEGESTIPAPYKPGAEHRTSPEISSASPSDPTSTSKAEADPTSTSRTLSSYICHKWEELNGIGSINSILSQSFKDAEDEDYPIECVDHSFKAAAEANVRKWSYVHSILKDHKAKGDCYASISGRNAKTRGASPAGYDYAGSGERFAARLAQP